MKNLFNFCDLMCEYAQIPQKEGLDGSGSCRTFIAIYCNLKKTFVQKNMPCHQKSLRLSEKETEIKKTINK